MKDRINYIQAKILKAIEKIAKDENVTIEFGNCKYNKDFYRTEMKVIAAEKVESLKEEAAKRYGLHPSILDIDFNHPKLGLCKVVDFKPQNRKYPIIFQSSDGKRYKVSKEMIKSYIGEKILTRNANLSKLFD